MGWRDGESVWKEGEGEALPFSAGAQECPCFLREGIQSWIVEGERWVGVETMVGGRGVDTFVQGTVVQGPLCPRDISPRRLSSKKTLVQGDYCPM